MAYAPTKAPNGPPCAEPGVLWAFVNNSASATDSAMVIPWDCRLVYGYGIVTTAVASGAMAVKLEQFAAGGTTLGTITFSSGDAVGQVRELTLASGKSAAEARANLGTGVSLNLEVDGGGAASKGGANIYLYFEAP